MPPQQSDCSSAIIDLLKESAISLGLRPLVSLPIYKAIMLSGAKDEVVLKTEAVAKSVQLLKVMRP